MEPSTAENGLWYCYDKQAWIQDSIVLTCGHPDNFNHACGCYGRDHAGERHDACPSCH